MTFISVTNNGIIQTDDYTIQVCENWSGDSVFIQINTVAKIGERSSNELYSLSLDKLNDLFKLMNSMELIDLSNVIPVKERIDLNLNQLELDLKF